MASFFVRWQGKVQGPLAETQLKTLALGGMLPREAEVSMDRVSWKKAAEIRGLFVPKEKKTPSPAPKAVPPKRVSKEETQEVLALEKDPSVRVPALAALPQSQPRVERPIYSSAPSIHWQRWVMLVLVVVGGLYGWKEWNKHKGREREAEELFNQAVAAENANAYPEAIVNFKKIVTDYHNTSSCASAEVQLVALENKLAEQTVQGLFNEAHQAEEAGNAEQARKIYERVIREYASQASRASTLMDTMDTRTVKKLFSDAAKAETEGAFDKARGIYEQIAKSFPDSVNVAKNALETLNRRQTQKILEEAVLAEAEGNLDKVKVLCEQIVQAMPSSAALARDHLKGFETRQAQKLFDAAQQAEAAKDVDKAGEIYAQVIRDYPSMAQKAAGLAENLKTLNERSALADAAQAVAAGDFSKARDLYKGIIQDYPHAVPEASEGLKKATAGLFQKWVTNGAKVEANKKEYAKASDLLDQFEAEVADDAECLYDRTAVTQLRTLCDKYLNKDETIAKNSKLLYALKGKIADGVRLWEKNRKYRSENTANLDKTQQQRIDKKMQDALGSSQRDAMKVMSYLLILKDLDKEHLEKWQKVEAEIESELHKMLLSLYPKPDKDKNKIGGQ